jgi:hypothetical protein
MNENLTSRITGKLGGLSDEMGRQLLDYIEFLESKYNRSSRTPSTVQRLAENIEDRIGGVRIADVAAKGTAQVVEAAGKLMEGLAAASKVVAEELATAPPTKGNGQQAEAPATDEAPSSADDASAGEEQQEPPEEPPAPA